MPEHPSPDSTLDRVVTRLIQEGREREAAALAADRLRRTNGGPSMDPRAQLDEILPRLDTLVASLDDASLDAPTPCADFTVRGVLTHMIVGATMFAGAFRGDAPDQPVAPTDVVAEFPKAMGTLRESIDTDGALERTIHAPFGDVPGEVFARFIAFDGLVHGWDIATATHQTYDPPETLVLEVDAFARQALAPEMRDGDTFRDEVEPPAGSTSLEHLVAFTGRQI